VKGLRGRTLGHGSDAAFEPRPFRPPRGAHDPFAGLVVVEHDGEHDGFHQPFQPLQRRREHLIQVQAGRHAPVDLVQRRQLLIALPQHLLRAPDPQDGVEARQQFLSVEGLGDVVIGAHLQAQGLVPRFADAGDQQHRNLIQIRIRFELFEDVKAVQSGQHHVEQHCIHGVPCLLRRVQLGQAFFAVGGHQHVITLRGQDFLDEGDDGRIIIHNQHTCRRHGLLRQVFARQGHLTAF